MLRQCLRLTLMLYMATWVGAAAVAADESDRKSVVAVIEQLQTTWNAADMTAYLALYRQDQTLRLVFGNTVVEGWAALDAMFRTHYPDELQMGKFSIDRVDVKMLSADTAVAHGTFTHVFPQETVHGAFTHALSRQHNGTWLIEHEHTSRGATEHHQ